MRSVNRYDFNAGIAVLQDIVEGRLVQVVVPNISDSPSGALAADGKMPQNLGARYQKAIIGGAELASSSEFTSELLRA